MIVDFNKSEINIIKEALVECAFEKYENKHDIDNIYKLAIIEYKIVKKQVEEGFLKKITGNLKCWWMWTHTDKNYRKRMLWNKRSSKR